MKICKIISNLGHLMTTMQLKLMIKTKTFAYNHITLSNINHIMNMTNHVAIGMKSYDKWVFYRERVY